MLIFAQRIGGYAGFLKDIFGSFLATLLFGDVSSVKRRSLEFRECAGQPKAHGFFDSARRHRRPIFGLATRLSLFYWLEVGEIAGMSRVSQNYQELTER
jgi:hypothetical protein